MTVRGSQGEDTVSEPNLGTFSCLWRGYLVPQILTYGDQCSPVKLSAQGLWSAPLS